MRVVPLALLLMFHCLAVAQGKAPLEKHLVGTWNYDASTMKIEPNAEGKKALNDPAKGKEARQMFAIQQKQLAASLKLMTVTFKADHRFVIKISKPVTEFLGTWSLSGNDVKVVMTNARQKTPRMEISKDGKRIHAVYSDPSIGVGKIDLVKA